MVTTKPGRIQHGYLALMTTGILAAVTLVWAEERPQEHPQEHPGDQKSKVSKETLAKAITDYVERDTELKGGFFLVYDPQVRKALTLTLDRVHDDRLSSVKEGLHFACADFKSRDAHLYDLDFFMRESEAGLQVSEITIHKADGIARYTWKEEQGVWKRQKVGER